MRSLDDLLADKTIELIVVTTPNATHFELAKQALEAGKHVVVDKPFTATSEEALTLGQLAKSKGLLAIPFHNRRWDGDFLTVKKLIAEQALGRLVTFELHFDRFRPAPREGVWQEAENPANGMLFDLGPHLVDQALALFGLPDSIAASVRSDRDGTAIEDAFDITLSYPGANGKGLLAHCRTSYLACDNSPRFLLHGTRGSFRKHGLDPQEPALVGGAKASQAGIAGRVAAGDRVGVGHADGCAESGRSGEAGREPGENRARRLSRLLRQCARRDPRRGAARFDGGGRIPRHPAAGAGSAELRRGARA